MPAMLLEILITILYLCGEPYRLQENNAKVATTARTVDMLYFVCDVPEVVFELAVADAPAVWEATAPVTLGVS
jgi:hypothetical protein